MLGRGFGSTMAMPFSHRIPRPVNRGDLPVCPTLGRVTNLPRARPAIQPVHQGQIRPCCLKSQ